MCVSGDFTEAVDAVGLAAGNSGFAPRVATNDDAEFFGGAIELAIIADDIVTMSAGAELTELFPSIATERRAVAIRAGKIVAIGSESDVAAWAPHEIRDVSGVLLPGFIDAHAHPVSVAHHQPEVDLTGLTTIHQLHDALRGQAHGTPEGSWVFGTNLEPNAELDNSLGAALIDAAVGDRPAYVRVFDGHSAVVSSAALALCGIDGPRQLGAGGEVVCDEQGRPTGELREDPAMELAEEFFPHIPAELIAARTLEILDDFAAKGVTCVNALDDRGVPWQVLADAEAIRPLPVRVIVSPVCWPGTTQADWQRLVDLQQLSGARWSVSGVKLFLDGTIDNGSGWMIGGDACDQGHDSIWGVETAEYRAAIAFFDANGVYTATHAIGDAAVGWAMDSIIAARAANTATQELGGDATPTAPIFHRIEHIEAIAPERVAQFAQHGIVVSMQPTHSAHFVHADRTDSWSRHMGVDRVESEGYRYRSLAETGAVYVYSSDWPVATFDPRQIVAAAVLQHPLSAEPGTAPVFAAQRMGFMDAMVGLTRNASVALNTGEVRGVLEVGAVADMVVWPTAAIAECCDALMRADNAGAAIAFANGAAVLTLVDGQVAFDACDAAE